VACDIARETQADDRNPDQKNPARMEKSIPDVLQDILHDYFLL
jgi:hypothetical protein